MDLNAAALVGEVHRGALRPDAVAEAALDLIAARDGAHGAFVDVDADALRADARALSARLRAGEAPPLAGAPLAVKDNIWIEGRRIAQGSRLFADHIAPRDAIAVARARDAGALIVGVTACSEFACKGCTTTPLNGPTRHPRDPTLGPGGSSGGSAVALAAGMAPLALGTDAGGSGRRPAAHCGVVGFKPSLGAIPYGPGFAEPFWDVSCIAPMARTVADAALLFDALAGPSPQDPSSRLTLAPPVAPHALRIAFAPRLGLVAAMDAAATAAVEGAVETLRRTGFAIVDAAPDWPEAASEAAVMPLQAAGLAALHGARWRAEPALFDPDIGAQIEAGLVLSGIDVARALEASRRIRETLAAFMTDFDLLLCPTTPCAAWPWDRLGPETIEGRPAAPRDHAGFTPLMNHARVPAISIPCGCDPAGLPFGLQIVAGFGRDRTALAAAQAFEAALAQGGAA